MSPAKDHAIEGKALKSDAEETENNKDVTDSGYSNSCSNSQSQRSGSSKCSGRNSAGSSGSGSSTFGVLAPTLDGAPKDGKERKDKKKDQDKKNRRKKNRSGERSTATTSAGLPAHNEEQFTEEPITAGSPLLLQAKPPVPQLMETGVPDNLLQVAALSQTLHTMRKMKYPDNKSDDSEGSSKEMAPPALLQQGNKAPSEIAVEQIASLKSEPLHEGELRIAVSMLDGVVVCTSGLTQALGYPKDMWIGRSLIDFVHSKHRVSFASFIIQSLAELHPGDSATNGQRNVYFCCLRKYRGLKHGFQLSEQPVKYLPCQITLQLKKLPPVGEEFLKECLIITAVPVRSAYKHADETRMSPKFTTRHSVNCQLVHVDPEVTPYFGYLPQDMLSRSVLDFYHPEDLHFLKEVYEAVIKEQGHPFRSKPYRFLCQNGGYALIETELSSFINPWTRKPEFIIGQHSVLRGPPNPDVTTPCTDPAPINISEEVLKETKIVQEEIKCLMNETVVRSTETAKQQVSKRCKDLAAFMENLMDEITKPPDLKIVVPTEEQSFSERDSVMLGEISPHHDYYDSKSMSETPPSYNQLNYNENIHRFFESKPKTTVSDESSGSLGDNGDNGDNRDNGDNKTGSSGEEGKTLTVNSSSRSKSGDSGASSGQSTGSHGHSGETNSNDTSKNSNNTGRTNTEGYKPPALTEQLLSRHNEDMEKQMVQKHRVSRTKSERDSKVKERLKTFEKGQDLKNYSGEESGVGMVSHGVKRSGSHSWEGEAFKTIKASHVTSSQQPPQQPTCPEPQLPAVPQHGGSSGLVSAVTPMVAPTTSLPTSATSAPVWPQYPMGSGNVTVPPTGEFPGPSLPTGALMPMYYLPNQRTSETVTHPSTLNTPLNYSQPAVQLMPSMLYHPFMYGTPPIQVYSPIMYPSDNFGLNNMAGNRFPLQRHPTIKTEPEGNVPSGSSTFTGPHTPRKEEPTVSTLKSSDNEGGSNDISTPYDDSSYQSSFYSFLKTDKSDESMMSENEKLEERGWGTKMDGKCKPIRKVAPWIENVNVTPELMFKYQLKERGLEETLRKDAIALQKMKQPSLVNEQLSQMYQDLEIEGLSKTLMMDEGMTSSSESSGDDTKPAKGSSEATGQKRRKRYMEYDKMTILFEEDAPMPPPIAGQCT